jgi:type VI secretion system secreted protein Hcp
MSGRSLILPTAAALALNAASAVNCHAAAVDYFLKIDGIQGEVTQADHKGEIQVESFSWGIKGGEIGSATGGAGAGKSQISGLTITKKTDKTSPSLLLHCATGQHYKEAIFVVVGPSRTHKGELEYLKLKLDNIIISSIQESGGGDVVPTESLTINFQHITIDDPTSDTTGNPTIPGETIDTTAP